ncbi:MAG: Zn-ribbon domain-containing OB-fold protein [Caulobacterales bacterium]
MDEQTLLKPALYQAQGSAAEPGHPALLGGVCACGYVFFPLQQFGCERCGGQDLRPRTLSGAGRLLASARVHLHAGKGREAPFTVGAIKLDDGPIVRTLIEAEEAGLHPGTRMVTLLSPVVDAEGAPRVDLRFTPER